MNKLLCFFLGHVPTLKFKINRTKRFESSGYRKERKTPFVVVSVTCVCKRCKKFLADAWWTE